MLESYERAFKRFESMARRIKNYSRFTDQEGRAATRNFWRLGGGSYSREAVQGVAGGFGIRNVGVSGRGRYLGSCRAIRSGGREEEARSVNAVEFLAFNRDWILREYRVNVSFEDLGGRREKRQFGPGLISTSPERRRMKTIFRRELTTGGRNGDDDDERRMKTSENAGM